MTDEILQHFHVPAERAADPAVREAAARLHVALERFALLLPPAERPPRPAASLAHLAGTNALDPLRIHRRLPVTVLFHATVHPSYYQGAYYQGADCQGAYYQGAYCDGEARLGEAPWRIVYTDGGQVAATALSAQLLDEAIRLAEAMHDKNPFGEVPFDGGKTVFLQEGDRFQAVTALYGDPAASRFILANGGIRFYAAGPVTEEAKRRALAEWAASSASAGVLGHRYIGGPDMRMGEEEMAWINAASGEADRARNRRFHPPVTGLVAEAGGFPDAAWELTGRTVVASLVEALGHPGCARYGASGGRPVRVVIQGFGDVGGSVARLLTELPHPFSFRIVGIADELAALFQPEGLDVPQLLALRLAERPLGEYRGRLEARWVARPGEADAARAERHYGDGREVLLEEADVLIPAAVPNVIDAEVAERLRVHIVAEGADNAVAPRVEERLHRRGILYLPGQALNWGGVKGSTFEVLFREGTKRTVPMRFVEERVRRALEPFGGSVDVSWALDLLRSGLTRAPLEVLERRALSIGVLEDLARLNLRWLMDELEATRHERTPLSILRDFSRTVRTVKARLLSLVEHGLGPEFFAPDSSLKRLQCLVTDRLKELLAGPAERDDLTQLQVVEQRQLLECVQKEILHGVSPILAALLAALDLARQKVMDPEGYTPESLLGDLQTLQDTAAPPRAHEESLHRLQRVHPGPARGEFLQALAQLLRDRKLSPAVRRNAALAMAKLGTADLDHSALLLRLLDDPDTSVRAAARWALHQMAITIPGEG